MAFIDLEKPFNNVSLNKILISLRELGIKEPDPRLIHNLYINQTANIVKGEVTASAQMKKGDRQGCTLSLPLFNCYIEKTINKVKARLTTLNIGIKIEGQNVSMIKFSDDIVMIAESEGNIQRAVDDLTEMFRISEMKINIKKTKILACAKNPKIKADIDSKELE